MGKPARGYTWRSFEPGETTGTETRFAEGNVAALVHGAMHADTLRPLAAAIAEDLVEDAPWLASRAMAGLVEDLAWGMAELAQRRAHRNSRALLDARGEERTGERRLARCEAHVANLRRQAGLTPESLVKILTGLSNIDPGRSLDGLDALKAAGRQIVEERERQVAAQLGAPTEDRAEETA